MPITLAFSFGVSCADIGDDRKNIINSTVINLQVFIILTILDVNDTDAKIGAQKNGVATLMHLTSGVGVGNWEPLLTYKNAATPMRGA